MPEHEFFDFSAIPEKKSPEIRMAGSSQSKNLHPEDNQDAFFIDPNHQSFGVFDGVAGAPNGKLAAETCSNLIQQYLSEIYKSLPLQNSNGIKEILQDISSKINSVIPDGYSTGVFGVIVTKPDGTRKAFIANVGDSRAYLIRHNVLYKETRDQNYVSYPNQDRLDKLKGKKLENFKQYYVHNEHIVGQLYGQQGITPVITEIDLESKDILLLVTDGVHKNLTKREILSTYKKNRREDINTISQKFIKRAYKRSQENDSRSTPDDMTVVLVKIK
jgi:protein phosphatase